MLYGTVPVKTNNENLHCYCQYGEYGIMIGCEKCERWFHIPCLGFTEPEIENIDCFYCNECLNSDSSLSIIYKVTPLNMTQDPNKLYCYCQECEYGAMIECNKCKIWFHRNCIDMTDYEIKSLLLYFCENCLDENSQLNIIFNYKDYTLEHTKPLFKLHGILTIHNLYPY